MDDIVRSAFAAATNFHEAAIRCLPSDALPTIVPFAMCTNIAFACELYLKAFLMALGIQPHGHSLHRLYNRLPESRRDEIAAKYAFGLSSSDVPLASALEEVSDAFVDWRYPYEREQSKLHVGALWRLARILFVLADIEFHNRYMSDWQRNRLATS